MAFRKGCQWRWKLDQIDGLKSKAFGVHMDFGTACHEAIELYRCRKPNPYVDIDVTVFYFKEKFRWLYSQHRTLYSPPTAKSDAMRCVHVLPNGERCWSYYKHKDAHEDLMTFFLRAGENVLRRFHECGELAEAEVLYNEHELYVDIERDDMEIKFKGFIDMVIKTKSKRGHTILYVVDFKTCSWGWPIEKKQDRDLHYQILLYKHFLCKKFNLDPEAVRCAFVLLKKKPRVDKKGVVDVPVEWFPVSAGPVSVQRAIDELNMDLTQIGKRNQTGEWNKDRKQCVNDFGEVCPYKDTPNCPNV